jgi:putative FmdB family regulatory protein
MPTYDYVCTACAHQFEHFQSMTSDLLVECPECHGSLRRKIGTGGALIFKGSGFYCTDYKKPSPEQKVEKAKEAAKEVKASSPATKSESTSAA